MSIDEDILLNLQPSFFFNYEELCELIKFFPLIFTIIGKMYFSLELMQRP